MYTIVVNISSCTIVFIHLARQPPSLFHFVGHSDLLDYIVTFSLNQSTSLVSSMCGWIELLMCIRLDSSTYSTVTVLEPWYSCECSNSIISWSNERRGHSQRPAATYRWDYGRHWFVWRSFAAKGDPNYTLFPVFLPIIDSTDQIQINQWCQHTSWTCWLLERIILWSGLTVLGLNASSVIISIIIIHQKVLYVLQLHYLLSHLQSAYRLYESFVLLDSQCMPDLVFQMLVVSLVLSWLDDGNATFGGIQPTKIAGYSPWWMLLPS